MTDDQGYRIPREEGDIDAELDPHFADVGWGYINPFDCPRCGKGINPVNETAVGSNGTEYDVPCESPNRLLLYHPSCWRERLAIIRSEENVSLDAFG